jgi:hypothetical protein
MKTTLLLAVMIVAIPVFSQNVGVNTPTPHAKAVLEVKSNDKGMLVPRITQAARTAMFTVPDPTANGMLVYQNDGTTGFYFYDGATWKYLAAGNFSLPHTSTHTVNNGYVLDLTNTQGGTNGGAVIGRSNAGNGVTGYSETATAMIGISSSGTGGYFSSATGHGLLVLNGNVGIGTTSPLKARFVVNGTVGAVSALFGESTTGVAIENSFPGIGFNSYYNNGRKSIGGGYGSLIGQDPYNGDFHIYTSTDSVTAGSPLNNYLRLLIKKNGHIGIQGNINPESPLSFGQVLGNKISLFGYSDTVQYGLGVQPFMLQLFAGSVNDDVTFGYGSSTKFTETMRIKGNGKLGIGTTTPAYPVTLKAEGTGFVQKGNSVEMGTFTSATGGYIKTLTNHPLFFSTNNETESQMALTTAGRLGLGTHLPFAKIDARDTTSRLLQLVNEKTLNTNVNTELFFKTGAYYTGSIGTYGTGTNMARLSFSTGTSLVAGMMEERLTISHTGKVSIYDGLEVRGVATLYPEQNGLTALVLKGGITANDLGGPAFTVGLFGLPAQEIVINHPLCNDKYNAQLQVTSQGPDAIPFFVEFDDVLGQWKIKTNGKQWDGSDNIFVNGTVFNVFVINR